MKFNNIIIAIILFGMLNISYAEGWSGQGEAGIVVASGNTDTETINIGLKFNNQGKVWGHEFAVSSFQSSNNNVDTADYISADYTLKRTLNERSNLFFNLGYLDDDFDGFTEQLSLSTGYGYKIIKNEKTTWETGIGVGYRDTSELITLTDGTQIEGDDISSATFVLRSDFTSQLTDNTKFIDSFKAEIGSDNTFIENDASLFVAMNKSLSLKVGLIVRHNTDPAIGADDTDTISSLSLVYGFGKK